VNLEGKTALLTGATGGLGRAIAKSLAERGAQVIVSSRRGEELGELAGALPGDGHRAIVADLALEGAGERLLAEAGEVDALVANAALPATGRLESFSEEEVTRALNVNLEAPIRMTHALLPAMLDRGEGHFVYLSSVSGKVPSPRASMYNATKFGLRGFALGVRQDLRGSGVGVSVVLPGFVRDAGMFADAGMKAPMGMGTSSPEEVGAGVVRAVERDKAEVVVAPMRQRFMAHAGHAMPRMAAAFQRGHGEKVADELASRQSEKR
jgi:short-subunit dehydrogenase